MLARELWFVLRDRTAWITLLLAFCASLAAVAAGLKSVNEERQLLEQLRISAVEDRIAMVLASADPGGMAYDAFHLTYDPPSPLAFAALGTRDTLPWRHRIRILALEGQIYEADIGNPELSLNGRLDYAFIAAVLMPLLLIFLLHDSEAGERRAARHELLCVSAAEGERLFTYRALLLGVLLCSAVVLPFLVAAVAQGASAAGIAAVVGTSVLSMLFWVVVCRFVVSRVHSGPTVAVGLLGVWLALAVLLPAGGKLAVRNLVDVPAGGELLLAQREAVNDAWDLPKETTMTPFLERHPRWTSRATIEKSFEWKWYYAFQQVGDQTVEKTSEALRQGVAQRDRLMSYLAVLSPPLLAERWMTATAGTDVTSFRRYENCVRSFHATLREYYYPILFEQQPFDEAAKTGLPDFVPCGETSTS